MATERLHLIMIPPALARFMGILPREYVCIAREDFPDTPSVHLTTRGSRQVIDVTDRHVMLGYKPLIIAIVFNEDEQAAANEAEICLTFTHGPFRCGAPWRNFPGGPSLARLELRKIDQPFAKKGLCMFVGVHGEHRFLNIFQNLASRVYSSFRRKPASEANLDGNVYDQVRIAYSIPRVISVITVKDDDLLNFFPTDLHGSLGADHYVSSLRIGGMACSQVETLRRLVIAKVDVASFRKTYALGANHMKSPQPAGHFEASELTSPSGIPIYPSATSYLELDLAQSLDIGIHRLFFYTVSGRGTVRSGKTLAHIHQHYALWRLNHGRSGEYFFR
jgi:flavin reductase (DIM6/NTAB) family NADH-FMN oxidoreductase RutF